ncbi:MAG: hypothetical protein AAF845_18490 [Bacteroidota bacterium]
MSPILTLAGAQLRADLRHPRSGKRSASHVATTVVAYGFSGTILALSLGAAPPEHILFVGVSFGIVLSAFGVVGAYDELMGRPRENAWLSTLPATEREHYVARLLGIAALVGVMALSVATPVGIRSTVTHGASLGLTIGVGIVASIVWTAGLALSVLWSLTLTLPQRVLRTTLSIARAVLIAALVLGFQLIGPSAEFLDAPWWPGAWFADAFLGRSTWGLSVLLFTIGGITGLLGAAFPHRYFGLLRRLAYGARQEERRGRGGRQLLPIEHGIARPGPIRAAYGFALAAFADDRIVRGRLWPAALLYAGFVVFGWMSDGLGSLFVYESALAASGPLGVLANPATQMHLSILIVLLFCAQSLVQTLQFSDNAEASWVFDALPEVRPRLIQLGAQKALVVRVLFPLHVGLMALTTAMMPAADGILHVLYWFALACLATRVLALLYRTPPFSRRGDRFSASSRFGPLLVSLPAGIAALLLQAMTFTSYASALGVSLTLLGLSAALAEAVTLWPQRRPASVAAPEAAPVPADAA